MQQFQCYQELPQQNIRDRRQLRYIQNLNQLIYKRTSGKNLENFSMFSIIIMVSVLLLTLLVLMEVVEVVEVEDRPAGLSQSTSLSVSQCSPLVLIL